MTITNLYTSKQIDVMKTVLQRNDWRLLINYGAVRSGKTVIDNDIFLMELRRIRAVADELDIDEPMYILAGYSSKSLQNNVLQELTNKYGIDFKFDKHGSFKLFGVKVVQTFTGSIAGLGAIRGMTSFGAYVNEASLANEAVFNEILDRCSAPDARIICDTNPDVPTHYLKKNYIDNNDPKAGIVSYHFTIDDNTFLPKEYLERKKAGTPAGMFYDRSILGLWVSGEGMVYRDFNKDTMVIPRSKLPDNLNYYCGVDWGYEHKGTIVVMADDRDGNTYLIEEHTRQFEEIDYWVTIAKEIQERYGKKLKFWADSARPEHVARFQREGLKAFNAKKSVLSGIESVAKCMKQGHFFVIKEAIDAFLDEIYQYVWDEATGLPVKLNDDVMDALRYAIYNTHERLKARTIKKPKGLRG
ncbi:PBSX family phage terminase large subunit [Lactiplantibacillus paraplantarum]|uniref:PBSX family phage terminase large subunit n=1 Tax=Lactiplantibacillus paraplantarum TaxID=60520 RepID=A0AAD0TR95_9LACO|nr:PBSX family phage terminase large subunit [Lactiplantibacillus paraplantarum]AYJ40137.1 PBSX family phage terminase large subunit [Lactiplantibacillus paraplantarum]